MLVRVAAVLINAVTSTRLGHSVSYTCCICKVVTVPTVEGHLAAVGEGAAQVTTSGINGKHKGTYRKKPE